MWPEKIESAYQSWIASRELFHPIDIKHFARFIWACIDKPSGAPNEVQFRERLARDRKLEPDEQGYPHPEVEKAKLIFSYFLTIWELRPDSHK